MNIIENVKEIASLIKKLDDVDLYRRILTLEQEVLELNEENRLFYAKIKNLENIEEITSKMSFKSPFWYMAADEIPYCPRCWEDDKKTIHLIDVQEQGYECPSCNRKFVMKDGKVINIRIKK